MDWPSPQDYNEALQNPQINFGDPQLKAGAVFLNKLGLPVVSSGAFASVYRVQCHDTDYAVRCFLHPVTDQQQRYHAISNFVLTDHLDCTVTFAYLAEGIRIRSKWYPVLKMQWVTGQPLDEYVKANLNHPPRLLSLAYDLLTMSQQMQASGIAHGDLQHGNIIITPERQLRLVDYDGMFVPALAGLPCPELGHRNYQHPNRSAKHFGPHLDNFSAWSIYTSLIALRHDPSLLDKLKGGDECLLFRQFDYKHPMRSRILATLEQHNHPEIQHLAKVMRTLLATPVEHIPPLGSAVEIIDTLPPLQANLPDWMLSGEVDTDDIDFRTTNRHDDTIVVSATDSDTWPTIAQYSSAIATPAASFSDDVLRKCSVVRMSGRIAPYTRNKNAIFRLSKRHSKENAYMEFFAVKVFLSKDESLLQRYETFSQFLMNLDSSQREIYKYIPAFHYQPNGIALGHYSFPIVKMDWQDGYAVDEWLEENTPDSARLATMRRQFREMCTEMDKLGIVHGELEAGNLIHRPELGLRLTDFDCVYVREKFKGRQRSRNAESTSILRHPTEPTYVDDYSDRFPAWVIDTVLTVIELAPELKLDMLQLLKQPWTWVPVQNNPAGVIPELTINSPLHTDNARSEQIIKQRIDLLRVLLAIDRSEIPRLTHPLAIDQQFARTHYLNFSPIKEGASLVSPDILPPDQTAIQTVPVNTAPASQMPQSTMSVAITGGLIVVAGMVGAFWSLNALFLPIILIGFIIHLVGLAFKK